MKPGDYLVYDRHNAECGKLRFGDTYTLDNLLPTGRVTLMQVPDYSFPVEAFRAAKCAHKEFVLSSRMRTDYRYRIYECEKCGAKRSTIEITVPAPGRGGTMDSWRARLMQKLSARQCKAMVEFMGGIYEDHETNRR